MARRSRPPASSAAETRRVRRHRANPRRGAHHPPDYTYLDGSVTPCPRLAPRRLAAKLLFSACDFPSSDKFSSEPLEASNAHNTASWRSVGYPRSRHGIVRVLPLHRADSRGRDSGPRRARLAAARRTLGASSEVITIPERRCAPIGDRVVRIPAGRRSLRAHAHRRAHRLDPRRRPPRPRPPASTRPPSSPVGPDRPVVRLRPRGGCEHDPAFQRLVHEAVRELRVALRTAARTSSSGSDHPRRTSSASRKRPGRPRCRAGESSSGPGSRRIERRCRARAAGVESIHEWSAPLRECADAVRATEEAYLTTEEEEREGRESRAVGRPGERVRRGSGRRRSAAAAAAKAGGVQDPRERVGGSVRRGDARAGPPRARGRGCSDREEDER